MKESFRKKLLDKLLSLTLEEIERRSKNVEKNLQKLHEYIEAKCVMVYYPLKGEVNLLGMVRKDMDKKRICFPFIEGRGLYPYEVKNLDEDFIKGPWGTTHPNPKKTKRVELEELDLVIVPGLGFSPQGYRLGRGAGFYDRFLKKLPKKIKKVGVAFDFQVIENLPHQFPHDEKVDILITDTNSL
ncbi:MAG: 5-formyltetrahydrofolate cyclo-ligase [Candidatus Omnitrophota bacterium]|nr:MAG: 5-formyltetrahydrofolate cyclo-ligase [Candidatus Omnitrophota bacterium]HDN85936.1 5-formyltetrahydrofolate cyclo-ligase [Candidatus Omnitrophota bacterium]